MPEKETIRRARQDAREGKAPTTQAGEFVREEVDHIREGKHGVRSAKQAIAIGLSKARRAGVDLPANPNDKSASAKKSSRKAPARKRSSETSATRSRAATQALKKESSAGASHTALSRQARKRAPKRAPPNRHEAAVKAAATRRRNKG